jgi:hypothetical protein
MSITLVSPLKVNIPITSTNSSLLNINNSQFLEGHPASYFYPASNPNGFIDTETDPHSLHLTGGVMNGDINMNENNIYFNIFDSAESDYDYSNMFNITLNNDYSIGISNIYNLLSSSRYSQSIANLVYGNASGRDSSIVSYGSDLEIEGQDAYGIGYNSLIDTQDDTESQIGKGFYSYLNTYENDTGYGFVYEKGCSSDGGEQTAFFADANYSDGNLTKFYGLKVIGNIFNSNNKYGIWIDDGFKNYIASNLSFGNGAVIDFNNKDVTLTHSSNKLLFNGGTIVSKGTWSGATNGFKVETPYTTTGLHMYYDTDDSCFYFENTDSASDLYFKGLMNFYDGIFTAGDLEVAGKVTAYGGIDPPNMQYTHTARQEVIDKYEKWACAGVPQTIEFYNIDTGFKEYYYPLLGEFRDSPSARYEVLFKLKKPLFNSDCETEYYFSSQTGKVESKIVANYDKFKLVDNIKLNKTTGELYDKETNQKVSLEDAVEVNIK